MEGNTCYPNRCTPFITAVAPSLPSPVFAAALRYNAPGVYDFGFVDPTLYYGPMAYTGVNDNLGGGYWEFNSGGYSLGNGTKIGRKMDIIADTGTSLLLADDVIVNAFYANVQGAAYNASYGAIIFPCSEAGQLADLSYYIGGAKHTMPGEYGIYGQVTSPDGYCYGGVQSNSGFGFTIMGDVFLKSQVVAFQTKPPRIGFAQSVFARDLLQ
jgi:aspergillopepsin I